MSAAYLFFDDELIELVSQRTAASATPAKPDPSGFGLTIGADDWGLSIGADDWNLNMAADDWALQVTRD